MRFFEILIIILAIIWLLQSFSVLNVNARVLTVVGIILLLSHWGFENGRWQLLLVYSLIVCLIFNQFLDLQIENKFGRWSLFLIASMAILISGGLSYLLPVFSVPKTTGPNFLISKNDFTRDRLEYKIWLPSNPEVTSGEMDVYHSDPINGLSGVMGLPGLVFSHLKLVKTNATNVADHIHHGTPKPLVLYSHGANSSHVDNTSLLEEIASNGFAVVAINHNFNFDKYKINSEDAKRIDIDTQKKLIDDLIDKAVPNQVTHYPHIIQELKEKYASQIDFTSIALIGHSLGGTTACNGSLLVDNVKAVVNMDGPIDKKIISDFSAPLLYLSSFSPDLSESELKKQRVPAEFYKGVKNYELGPVKELFSENEGEKFWVRFKNANHLDFTDIPYIIPFMSAPYYDKNKGHELKSKIIVSFLNRELNSSMEKLDFTDEDINWIQLPNNS